MRYYSSPTVFVFECDICHGQIRVQNEQELTKCGGCGKKLCTTCAHHRLCQADFARIPPEDQEKLKQIDAKYDLAKAANVKKTKKIMLLLLVVVLSNLFIVPGGIQMMFGYNPGFIFISFLPIIAMILVAVYWFKVGKQYTTLDIQRKSEQMGVIQPHFPKQGVPVPEDHFPPQPVQGLQPASNLKICSNCGQAIPPNAKFCEACGQKIA